MARDTSSEEKSGSSSGLSLAERLRAGAPDAWRDLVELYGPLLDRWCRAANVPPDSASDVAQDVFLAAFRGFDRFDSLRADATFRGWLWTIARSRIVEYHRRQQGRHMATGGSTAQARLQSIIDPIPLDDPTEPDQASALLHRALEQIRSEFTEDTWELFWRHGAGSSDRFDRQGTRSYVRRRPPSEKPSSAQVEDSSWRVVGSGLHVSGEMR